MGHGQTLTDVFAVVDVEVNSLVDDALADLEEQTPEQPNQAVPILSTAQIKAALPLSDLSKQLKPNLFVASNLTRQRRKMKGAWCSGASRRRASRDKPRGERAAWHRNDGSVQILNMF